MIMSKKTGVAPRLAEVLSVVLGTAEIPVRLKAWDGSEAGPAGAPVIEFRSRRALRRMLWSPGQLGLSRAYVAGDIDAPGTDLGRPERGDAGRTLPRSAPRATARRRVACRW